MLPLRDIRIPMQPELPGPAAPDHQLAEHFENPSRPVGFGPIVGVIIVVVLMLLGALYFWGAQLNQKQETLPYIPSDGSTQ